VIVAGFGFRAAADLSALHAALALAQQGHPPITALAAPDDKMALVDQLGTALGLPVIPVAGDRLQAAATSTQSLASLRARRTGSVAEAAALAAAGSEARLIAGRHISPDRTATCAIAQGPGA